MTGTPKQPDESPLRGTLPDDAHRPGLHDMGGRTGPASDRSAAAVADTGPRGEAQTVTPGLVRRRSARVAFETGGPS